MTRSSDSGTTLLGKESVYPSTYAPHVLQRIARGDARLAIGIKAPLPFVGIDHWTAWELTWLDATGKPVVVIADIGIPATSKYIIESKSMKIYLGSFAMSRFDNCANVAHIIENDLSRSADETVTVDLLTLQQSAELAPAALNGRCLDTLDLNQLSSTVDPNLLQVDSNNETCEVVHSHLLRSLCPVTAQPDLGSVEIRYRGAAIDSHSLLSYIVSFREHNDFHEACVERMFIDISERCQPVELSILARYQRRGGIDINPFRSNTDALSTNRRLVRQ